MSSIGWVVGFVFAWLGLSVNVHAGTCGNGTRGMVITCQPLAAEVGAEILRSGGNAADAFIATTLAEYVTAYGYTSLNGPLYLLYFDAKTTTTTYLNAGLAAVQDPEGAWSGENPPPGKSNVIAGAGRGLESLYRGGFADEWVSSVRFRGGSLNHQDLLDYREEWREPLEGAYRGIRVKTSSALETTESLQEWVDGDLADRIAERVQDRTLPAPFSESTGNHSCATLVIDAEGSIANGVHTINSPKWGEFGIFAGGVALNSAHAVAMGAGPGKWAWDSLNPVIAFENGKPLMAAGFFASGLGPAALQVMVNLLDYGMNPEQALDAPRFGAITNYRNLEMLLDARFPRSWASEFSRKGIHFVQPDGFIDTGMGTVLRMNPSTHEKFGCPSELVPEAVALME